MLEMNQDPLSPVINAVQGIYGRKDQAHDLEHALRVREWGKKIGIQESADLVIVELAAILHDIGRSGTLSRTHAESGSALAGGILQKCGYPENIIEAVKTAVLSHSREGYEPETLEAKILYDADKLDFVGPIGIARLFAWAGKEGKPFFGPDSCESFYRERISHYHKHLYTETARVLFEPLFLYSENFWSELEKMRLKKD
ncbi:HD domain-containing protein [Desulfitobacterium sp. PCE1]|uniref:HD domain-containing protein n=1 Tax=Desulfitobacterium sp. PCE1 TaxID=146907 RepID=UPI00036F8227|nr:HD domain-containing protein [Desulfitobacterium sp. PCE1]